MVCLQIVVEEVITTIKSKSDKQKSIPKMRSNSGLLNIHNININFVKCFES